MALMKAHITALLLVYIGLSQLQSLQLPDPFRLSSCIYCSMQKGQCGMPVNSVYALPIPSVIIIHIAFIVVIILILHIATNLSLLGLHASEMKSYTPQCGHCMHELCIWVAHFQPLSSQAHGKAGQGARERKVMAWDKCTCLLCAII